MSDTPTDTRFGHGGDRVPDDEAVTDPATLDAGSATSDRSHAEKRERLSRRRVLARIIGGALTVAGGAIAGSLTRVAGARADCLRPPGALEEDAFLSTCIRCGRCADACPNRCITQFTRATGKPFSMRPGRGQHATPVIYPRRQACMLCNGAPGENLLCTEACPTGALKLTPKDHQSVRTRVTMGTAIVDTHLCHSFNGASCGACVRACPLEGKALTAGLWEKPIVDPSECVGCGLCERACVRYPQAIRVRPRNADEAVV